MESKVVKACLELLALKKIMAWRNNQGAIPNGRGGFRKFVGRKGVSDILAIAPDGSGRFLGIECKTATGKLDPEQKEFMDEVRAHGGLAFVVRSVGELDDILRREFP